MTRVTVGGWHVLCSAGTGAAAVRDRLAYAGSAHPGGPVDELYPDPLPAATGHALAGFDIRAHFGRKGTSFYDRVTSLAAVACHGALDDARPRLDGVPAERVGLVLGTTMGSFTSTCDYSRDTLGQDKPYLVNPVLFPNAVMNCAAGQSAIRFGLRGVNSTIAGGRTAMFQALRYAANALDRGHADAVLVGAVEEYTPHRAWANHLAGRGVPTGEAAAVFVLGRSDDDTDAEVLAVAAGYGPGGAERADRALEGCVRRAVRQAEVAPERVTTVLTGELDTASEAEYGPATAALGHRPPRILVSRLFGECDAVTGGLELAAVLARHQTDPRRDGQLSLLTARDPDGAVAAAVVRGWSRAGADRD
jgi:3-oxoacyl-[acyl-carrier-protein] synthase II